MSDSRLEKKNKFCIWPKLIQPAFMWAQHLKAGRNTQQLSIGRIGIITFT